MQRPGPGDHHKIQSGVNEISVVCRRLLCGYWETTRVARGTFGDPETSQVSNVSPIPKEFLNNYQCFVLKNIMRSFHHATPSFYPTKEAVF